jgi:hypothetical protein
VGTLFVFTFGRTLLISQKVALQLALVGFSFEGVTIMRKTFQIAAVALFPIIALAGQARAIIPLTLTLTAGQNYSADLIWNNDGTVSFGGIAYTAVQQQSELWSNFTSSSSLPAGSAIDLSFAIVGGQDYHTVSFAHAFGSAGKGSVFTFGYKVSDAGTPNVDMDSLNSSIGQNVGSSTLDKTAVSNTGTYTLDVTENGTVDIPPTPSVSFLPGTTTVTVTDTFTISPLFGSDAYSVGNTFVEDSSVPEPATWVMMLLGFAGLGFAGYRKADRMSSAA